MDHVHGSLLRKACFPLPLRVKAEDLAHRLGVRRRAALDEAGSERIRIHAPSPEPVVARQVADEPLDGQFVPASYRRRRRPIVTRKWDSGGTAI